MQRQLCITWHIQLSFPQNGFPLKYLSNTIKDIIENLVINDQ